MPSTNKHHSKDRYGMVWALPMALRPKVGPKERLGAGVILRTCISTPKLRQNGGDLKGEDAEDHRIWKCHATLGILT